jgi:hypothetical protein
MIEVFITDVEREEQAKDVIVQLSHYFPGSRINFDLEDCDHILRIESRHVETDSIVKAMHGLGYKCDVLL